MFQGFSRGVIEMNHKSRIGWLLALWLSYTATPSAAVQINGLDWNGTRPQLRVDLSAVPTYRITRSAQLTRMVLDLGNSTLAGALKAPPASHAAVARLASRQGKNGLQLLLDLKAPAAHKVRLTKDQAGAHLFLEWLPSSAPAVVSSAKPAPSGPAPALAKTAATAASPPEPHKSLPALHSGGRPFVVAIDAGHGGKDTGAIGPSGVREKDVVLNIARKLADFIRATPGLSAVMIRRSDEFVDLRERVEIARKARADLFVSLHADAHETDGARGSSVFTLSEHGASSEAARCLADSENAALLGGLKLKDKNKLLASVLLDLSKNATLEESDKAAAKVLHELRKDFQLHHQEVQKAGFVVLKSLDIPSMLVETAFISNPDEEKNLLSPKHQDQVARSVFRGIRAYFAAGRPAGQAGLKVARAEDGTDPKKAVVRP